VDDGPVRGAWWLLLGLALVAWGLIALGLWLVMMWQ
jgi:hypothetical protein